MKHKRLNRDLWGFSYYPYYQMRIDEACFHGLACLIRLTDGEPFFWELPKAGRVQVTGSGVTWLELVPDGKDRVVTAIYAPSHAGDPAAPGVPRPSVWYVDVIDHMEADDCGVAVFADAYLDVIFTTAGDVRIDDRDELDLALADGGISEAQYSRALRECDAIVGDLCADIGATERRCAEIRRNVEKRIARGEPVHPCREILELGKTWEFRALREEEAPECASVIRTAFRTVADAFGFTEANAPRFTAFSMTDARMRRELSDPRREGIGCFCAHTGALVGCCILAFAEDGACELDHLAVLPAYRHRRLGRLLVREALIRAYARGCRKMTLGFVNENDALKAWYESLGFTFVGAHKFDHLPFTSGYMEKTLADAAEQETMP